jgi:hypothetical protein
MVALQRNMGGNLEVPAPRYFSSDGTTEDGTRHPTWSGEEYRSTRTTPVVGCGNATVKAPKRLVPDLAVTPSPHARMGLRSPRCQNCTTTCLPCVRL